MQVKGFWDIPVSNITPRGVDESIKKQNVLQDAVVQFKLQKNRFNFRRKNILRIKDGINKFRTDRLGI